MGCECFCNIFKKSGIRNDDIDYERIDETNEENRENKDPCFFDIKKARKIVSDCFSNYRPSKGNNHGFSKYIQDIVVKELDDKDFQDLFEGCIDDDKSRDKICQRYSIIEKEKDVFHNLIIRIENLSTFFNKWYKDKSKHSIIIDLWNIFPGVNKLKDEVDNESFLEDFLKEANYSNWDKDTKEEFKECINNSPEIKSLKVKKFINKRFPEARTLIDSSFKFIKSLEKNCEAESSEFKSNIMKNIIYFTQQLIQDFINDFIITNKKEISGSKSFKDSIIHKIENYVFNSFDEDNNLTINDDSFINFNKVQEMSEQLKNGELLNYLQQQGKTKQNTNLKIMGGINICLGLFTLYSSIHELYKCLTEHDKVNPNFQKRLDEIKQSFEEHRNIGILDTNYNKALETVYDAIENVKEDRNNLINLIQEIKYGVAEKKKEKTRCIIKIIKNIVKVGICVGGAIATGGVGAVAFGIAGGAHAVRVIKHGINLKDRKSVV